MVSLTDLPVFTNQDWLLIVGFVATAATLVATARSGNKILANKLEVVDGTVEDLKEEIKSLSKVIVTQAEQGAQITFLQQQILNLTKRLDQQGLAINNILFERGIKGSVLIEGPVEQER